MEAERSGDSSQSSKVPLYFCCWADDVQNESNVKSSIFELDETSALYYSRVRSQRDMTHVRMCCKLTHKKNHVTEI